MRLINSVYGGVGSELKVKKVSSNKEQIFCVLLTSLFHSLKHCLDFLSVLGEARN